MTTSLASNLAGKTINGWLVVEKITKGAGETGGNFSSGYVVRNIKTNEKAFMKAINVGYAIKRNFGSGNSLTDLLKDITEDFQYERDLLKECGTKLLDRIVLALDSGEYIEATDPYFVPYLVFEYCEGGNIRRHIKLRNPDLAWRLRVFHGVCAGVGQLHSINVAHHDVKPSNVLVFPGENAKLADLGRSAKNEPGAKFNQAQFAGDPNYAPIEHHYNWSTLNDFNTQHKCTDQYMLGGVLAYLVANIHLFGLILGKINPTYHPRIWKGRYKDALPAIQQATIEAITEIVAMVPIEIQDDVRNLLYWLCNPDPELRGHPDTVGQATGDRYSLERIITAADLLAVKVRLLKK